MIRAASLFYAIIICVLVGIFCYSLLLISNYMSLHEGMMNREKFLLRTNEAARIYYRHQIQEGKLGMTKDNDVLENGISSRAELNTWGVYNMLKVMTFSGKDTVYKIDLLKILYHIDYMIHHNYHVVQFRPSNWNLIGDNNIYI